VLHLSGISLNRSTTAPQPVSEAGEKVIVDNEEVKSASETIETLQRSILDKHISIAPASMSSDPLVEEYVRAVALYRFCHQIRHDSCASAQA
jgi:predicted translin family RNA/ssDNA-binding protein